MLHSVSCLILQLKGHTFLGIFSMASFHYLCCYTPRVRSRSEDRRARPGGGSRSCALRRAHGDGRKSLRRRRRSPGGRSDRSTTSPRPQNAAQRHVSPSAARSSAPRAVSRILVTTSVELFLLPVGGRHLILNLGRHPLARYSDSDIPPSSSHAYPAYRTFRVQNGG